MDKCIVNNRQCLILTGTHGHTPSRDCACDSGGSTSSGQSHRLHILVDDCRFAQLDQHDVIVHQPGLVVWMRDHVGSRNDLFFAIHEPTVVIAEDNVHLAERENGKRGTCEKLVLFCCHFENDIRAELTICSSGQQTPPSSR